MAVVNVKIIGFLDYKMAQKRWCVWELKKSLIHVGPNWRKIYYMKNKNLQMNKLGGDYSFCKRVFKGFP